MYLKMLGQALSYFIHKGKKMKRKDRTPFISSAAYFITWHPLDCVQAVTCQMWVRDTGDKAQHCRTAAGWWNWCDTICRIHDRVSYRHRCLYSRHPLDPYPSVDSGQPSYGLWEVMDCGKLVYKKLWGMGGFRVSGVWVKRVATVVVEFDISSFNLTTELFAGSTTCHKFLLFTYRRSWQKKKTNKQTVT